MNSSIFNTNGESENIESKIKDFLNKKLLNNASDSLSANIQISPRAAGDAIQQLLSEEFQTLLKPGSFTDYRNDFTRRAMEDFAFNDMNGNYYAVDVKTHRTGTKFNMPNLTSVERLARFYEEENNYFVILMVSYNICCEKIKIENVHFVPVEFLDWQRLTIGALGWGQLQIKNSNNISIDKSMTRKKWMMSLCDALLEFYPDEIAKIKNRIQYFDRIKETWLAQPDE